GLDGMAAAPGGAGREADFALAAALGLQAAKGAREINFRRGAFAYKGAGLADRPLVLYLATMGLAIVLLAGYNLFAGGPSGSQVEAMEAETRRLFREAFPEVTRIVSPVDQAASEMQKLRNKIAVLAPRMSGGLTPLEVLREVSTRVPKETVVDVTELSLDDDKIKIAGVTETSDSFRAIQEALQKVAAFKRVEIFKSDRTADGKVSFELRISMGEGQP
ncbi:MAG: PilN domain-containing protein, partial [Candidatus Methylomirabilis sp.]|nr:PilN domain-containing protein [Deltaproteobacteria bacterium]